MACRNGNDLQTWTYSYLAGVTVCLQNIDTNSRCLVRRWMGGKERRTDAGCRSPATLDRGRSCCGTRVRVLDWIGRIDTLSMFSHHGELTTSIQCISHTTRRTASPEPTLERPFMPKRSSKTSRIFAPQKLLPMRGKHVAASMFMPSHILSPDSAFNTLNPRTP